MNSLEAYKMDGLGNDFIIVDKRENSFSLTRKQIIKISDRNSIGCDQVIFINKDPVNDAFLQFYNSDGGEVSACGNGSRCVAYLLMRENNSKSISLKTKSGILKGTLDNKNLISINIGQPNFKWNLIPLLKDMNTRNLNIEIYNDIGKKIVGGFSLNVGNPHIIFFVKDLNQFDIKEIGPQIENHKYFPEKCNVTLACIENKKNIKVKVWERGAGLTKACGTAACATAVASAELKLTDRCVDIKFQQGFLNIDWKMNNHIYMKGKVSEIKKIIIDI
jgi:diaminopimelate epimerase